MNPGEVGLVRPLVPWVAAVREVSAEEDEGCGPGSAHIGQLARLRLFAVLGTTGSAFAAPSPISIFGGQFALRCSTSPHQNCFRIPEKRFFRPQGENKSEIRHSVRLTQFSRRHLSQLLEVVVRNSTARRLAVQLASTRVCITLVQQANKNGCGQRASCLTHTHTQ